MSLSWPAPLETLTIRPPELFKSCGRNPCDTRSAPNALVAIVGPTKAVVSQNPAWNRHSSGGGIGTRSVPRWKNDFMFAVMNDVTTFEQHRPLLFAIAYRMLGGVAEAEDMVQETF